MSITSVTTVCLPFSGQYCIRIT